MRIRGFTTIELFVVIGILAVILAGSAAIFSSLLQRTQLDSAVKDTVQLLRTADAHARARYRDLSWGVHVDDAEQRVTLFAGSSYASRNQNFDVVVRLASSLRLENRTLTGGGNEIIFQKGSSTPSATGTFEISHTGSGRYRISINSLGSIEYIRII